MWNSNQPKPWGEFHMMMKLLMSNTQGVRTYLGLFQVIMANVGGRDGRRRFVGVWRRVGFKQKVNFRGVETEFRSNWTPYEWLEVPGRFQRVRTGWCCDGRGYLKMPRRLGEKYSHRQLLEDFGVAYAGHEMVIHHEDEDICNNSFENSSFVTRQMQAALKPSEGEAPFDLQTFILPPLPLRVGLDGASGGGLPCALS